MSELTEFLRARLGEDDQAAHDILGRTGGAGLIVTMFAKGSEVPDKFAHRVLREVEAKRRIMALHVPRPPGPHDRTDIDECAGCGVDGPNEWAVTEDIEECPELRNLASIYADHDDYLAKWRL